MKHRDAKRHQRDATPSTTYHWDCAAGGKCDNLARGSLGMGVAELSRLKSLEV